MNRNYQCPGVASTVLLRIQNTPASRFGEITGVIASERLVLTAAFQCGYCGSWNDIVVDSSAGRAQTYSEDCQVCCRANLLHITYSPEIGEYEVSSELE